MKICGTCGTQFPDDAVFCANCGTSLEDKKENTTVFNNAVNETNVLDSKKEKTLNKKTFAIVSAFVILLTVIVVLLLIIIKPIKGNSNTYNNNINNNIGNNVNSNTNNSIRKVKILSVSNNKGMTSQDAEVSYTGYEYLYQSEEPDESISIWHEGLCINGTLEYPDESFFDSYVGHGGELIDKNGNVVEYTDISERSNMEEYKHDLNYELSFYSDPFEKIFSVGLPDDIQPGIYTINIYQIYENNTTEMDIKIEVE